MAEQNFLRNFSTHVYPDGRLPLSTAVGWNEQNGEPEPCFVGCWEPLASPRGLALLFTRIVHSVTGAAG
jgi:hypothetical protein